MRTAIAEILQREIQEFLMRGVESKLSLAEKAKVPISILQRMIDGDGSAAEFEFVYSVLSIISPDDARDILQEHYPFHVKIFKNDSDLMSNVKRSQNALNFALKNRLSYQIHSMASCHHGASEEEIEGAFGKSGLRVLGDMIQMGLLTRSEAGRISDPYLNTIQSNIPQLVQMIHYNLGIFDPEERASAIINIIEGFNEEAIKKLLNKWKSLWSEILDVCNDPTNWGPHRLYISGLMGPVAPSLSRVNYTKNTGLNNVDAEAIAEIVHDIRRPLREIMNFFENLNHEGFSVEDLAQVKRSARRVDRMIESLHKNETSDLVSRRMGVFYLDPILDLCGQLAVEHGKTFRFSGNKEFSGYLDQEKLERLLQNLLVNAFDAAVSQVDLKASRRNDKLEFVVSDDGPGVPSNVLPSLFSRGFTHGKANGTGLGLYIAQSIADAHDGEIKYERQAATTEFIAILSGVFAENDDEVNGSLDCQDKSDVNSLAKPLLFFRASNSLIHEKLLNQIAKFLPMYDLSDNYKDFPEVWLVCTDDIPLALQASEAGVPRVWTPSSKALEHADFIGALKSLALAEFEKFKLQKVEYEEAKQPRNSRR